MDEPQSKRQAGLICLGLALAVFVVYSPLWHSQFVAFDDNDYVTSNDMVQHGISWAGMVWAFSTFHASIWHPLTWLSYQLDSQFYGMNPGGFHFTNVLLHAVNSILLFLLLQRMTKALWRSALVAALFALHPQHVESVAWISERKDVLSTLFWMLTVWAYVRHVENPKRKIFYVASVVLFALGLMAKPMLVTLPFILLLLDAWPLRRRQAFAEKAPFFILAAGSCALTLFVARHEGAIKSTTVVPLAARLENIPVSYVRYIAKTFWPDDLAVLYPYRYDWSAWQIAGSVALLVVTTGMVAWRWRTRPWWMVGWLWFVVMLAPVIGLIQAGPFSIADRYSYLSTTGLFIAIVWTVRTQVGAALILAACVGATSVQVRYWHDSEALLTHTLAVTNNNGVIESDLGKVLLDKGRVDDALLHLQRAVAVHPTLALAHYNLGNALLAKGSVADALQQFEIHVGLNPADPIAQFNFGSVLLDQGLAADAIPHLEIAAQIRPRVADYHFKLGNACRQSGRAAEAISQYEATLKILPQDVQAASSLAWMLATSPDVSLRNGRRALDLALLVNQLSGGHNPKMLGILAAAYAESGDFANAVGTAQRALQLAENVSALADTLREQLTLYRTAAPFREKP